MVRYAYTQHQNVLSVKGLWWKIESTENELRSGVTRAIDSKFVHGNESVLTWMFVDEKSKVRTNGSDTVRRKRAEA